MDPYKAYCFLFGLFIGGYTNFFSKIVISGLVLYIIHPENFSIERFEPLYERICEKTHPYISKIYTLDNIQNIQNVQEEKVSIIPSPSPLNLLIPPIKLNIKK
jgi:hypothetical protein